ncbi:MAG: helix-turn-helix domain-containing protein [Chitinophagaceae bacterium]
MKFETHIPNEALRPYVKALVISEQAGGQVYTVLPDTSLVIGIQYRGGLSLQRDGQFIRLDSSGITGLQDRFNIFKNESDTSSVLIYFTPTGASAFLAGATYSVFGESVGLEELFSRSLVEKLREELSVSSNDTDRILTVERFLLSALKRRETDPLINESIRIITRSNGLIRINELYNKLHISASPFEKRFRSVVGATPKKFVSIVRLKSTLALYPRANSLTDLAHRAGYYDQAHFIHQFGKMTGQTPHLYFSSLRKG